MARIYVNDDVRPGDVKDIVEGIVNQTKNLFPLTSGERVTIDLEGRQNNRTAITVTIAAPSENRERKIADLLNVSSSEFTQKESAKGV